MNGALWMNAVTRIRPLSADRTDSVETVVKDRRWLLNVHWHHPSTYRDKSTARARIAHSKRFSATDYNSSRAGINLTALNPKAEFTF